MISKDFLLFSLVCLLILNLISCNNPSHPEDHVTNWDHHDLKTRQYLIPGRNLYKIHCANCHMDDGKGLVRLIPPLAQSDYMLSNVERTICIIKYGMSGEIVVNNQVFNHPMPGNINLTDIEIAEISTYIYNAWGHSQGIITIPEVRKALNNCREN